MNPDTRRRTVQELIAPGAALVKRHLEVMARLVAVDSRSFNVNEFPGDRTEVPDMQEILALARDYLSGLGFGPIEINRTPDGGAWPHPILMAELSSAPGKPTVLLYAHLDKQPYMDDDRWHKWGGIPPTQLHWNAEGTRAFGRGAADDLSGVVAIGMAVDACLQSAGGDPARLPCNLKIIFETEEESGSSTLIEQMLQNRRFFEGCDCVVITDVTNPDTGIPGLTTSLRGILQMWVTVRKTDAAGGLAEQAALYKLLASLIHDDHTLAVEAIAARDIPVTPEERAGYGRVPITLKQQREAAGLLPQVRLVVPETAEAVIECQLRQSYVNVRPGHRVAGGVVFGAAGARLGFPLKPGGNAEALRQALLDQVSRHNPFHLKLTLEPVAECRGAHAAFDLLVQSAAKDPHSGIIGGPFPVPELQLARMIDALLDEAGGVRAAGVRDHLAAGEGVSVAALHVEHDGQRHPFDQAEARALVEIRLAPGNQEQPAAADLTAHLNARVPAGFAVHLTPDKGGGPWMTGVEHPVFGVMLEALQSGYDQAPCLFGCGGSIPFVAKLMEALGAVAPLCIGAYDPDSRLHEPGESLSMQDLLGCARSIVHFLHRVPEVYPSPKPAKI